MTQPSKCVFIFAQMQVYVNSKRIYPAYRMGDIALTSTGVEVVLEIPDLKVQVSYKGSSFSINLPYSLFQSSTEGQCGEYY